MSQYEESSSSWAFQVLVQVQEPASPRLMPLDVSKLTGELARVAELRETPCLADFNKKFKTAEEAFSEIVCHPLFQHYANSMAVRLETYKRKFQVRGGER